LEPLERQFLVQSGEFVGACKHIGADDGETLKIELISDEAVKTSEIEGEMLNRDNVQSSLRHQFGLGAERPGVKPAERGISKMMVDLYHNFAAPLTDKTLFDWHGMLLGSSVSVPDTGRCCLIHSFSLSCPAKAGHPVTPQRMGVTGSPGQAGR
jgi:hypothetical protein